MTVTAGAGAITTDMKALFAAVALAGLVEPPTAEGDDGENYQVFHLPSSM